MYKKKLINSYNVLVNLVKPFCTKILQVGWEVKKYSGKKHKRCFLYLSSPSISREDSRKRLARRKLKYAATETHKTFSILLYTY